MILIVITEHVEIITYDSLTEQVIERIISQN